MSLTHLRMPSSLVLAASLSVFQVWPPPVHVVHAHAQVAGLPEVHGLVGRQAHVVVVAVEQVVAGLGARRVAVVDVVAPPVDVGLHAPLAPRVVVVSEDRRRAAPHVRPHVLEGALQRARVVGVGLRHGHGGARRPVAAQLVAKVDHLVGKPEGRPGAVAVAAVELPGRSNAEASAAVARRQVELLRVEGAEHRPGAAVQPVARRLARDDVHRAPHGVRAVEQRARALHHLHPLNAVGNVRVGQRVAEHRRPLRLTVDHEQHLVALAHAADVDRAGGAAAHAVAREAALRCEQPRHAVRQHRQQRALRGMDNHRIAQHRHVERQQLHACLRRRRHQHLL